MKMQRPSDDDLVTQLGQLRLPVDDVPTVIDLSGVEALTDVVALSLIRSERRFRSNGRHLSVEHTSRTVRRQLVALGLGSLLRRPSDQR